MWARELIQGMPGIQAFITANSGCVQTNQYSQLARSTVVHIYSMTATIYEQLLKDGYITRKEAAASSSIMDWEKFRDDYLTRRLLIISTT